ncbi:hypothetical protein [Streptomyces sp. NPDC013457]|uniref:hypothetical protein n=1 Tax=Streptomyces sp. NPDC013457 TaxID=3364866 RepID=UPI0036F6F7A0
MQIAPSLLLDLVRNIASTDPKTRERAAERVTDLESSYSVADGRVLTGGLAAAAACERDAGTLEAELNAIIQLGSLAEPEMVLGLQSLNTEDLPRRAREVR